MLPLWKGIKSLQNDCILYCICITLYVIHPSSTSSGSKPLIHTAAIPPSLPSFLPRSDDCEGRDGEYRQDETQQQLFITHCWRGWLLREEERWKAKKEEHERKGGDAGDWSFFLMHSESADEEYNLKEAARQKEIYYRENESERKEGEREGWTHRGNPVDMSEIEYLKGNFHVIVVDVLTILNVNCICRSKNVQLHPILAVKNDNLLLTVKVQRREKQQQPQRGSLFSLWSCDLPAQWSHRMNAAFSHNTNPLMIFTLIIAAKEIQLNAWRSDLI